MQSSTAPTPSASAATSAPVHEFICLYTHDLRRKQKRWQDGRLKYHTHNSRVMVHDESGNTVGDTHWHKNYDLDSGEVINLDRGGVIVEVGDLIVTRNQDLTELVDKRLKEKAERQSAAAARRPARPLPPAEGLPTPTRPLYPPSGSRPLHEVVGTPTGHYGRAHIPSESPFEQRQKVTPGARDDPSPPAKRQRRAISPPSKSGYAQSLFGAPLSLSLQPMSSAPLRSRPINTSSIYRPVPVVLSSSPVEVEPLALPTASKPPERPRVQSSSIATGSMSLQAREALPSLLQIRPQEKPAAKSQNSRTQSKPRITSQDVEQESTSAPRSRTTAPTIKKRGLSTLHETLDRSQMSSGKDAAPREAEIIEIQSSKDVSSQGEPRRKTKKKRVEAEESTKPKKLKNKPRAAVISNRTATHENSNLAGSSTKVAQSSIEPEDDGPRTELRIKPRKKRGLLMLAHERSTGSDKSASQQLSRLSPTPPTDYRIAKESSKPPMSSDAVLSKPTSKAKTVRAKTPKDTGRQAINIPESCKEPESALSTMPSPPPVPRERTRRKAKTVVRAEAKVSEDDSLDDMSCTDGSPERPAPKPVASGPRLIRFARKHINSKEIIGLHFDDDGIPSFGRPPSAVIAPALVSEPPHTRELAKQKIITTPFDMDSSDAGSEFGAEELAATKDESETATSRPVPSADKPTHEPQVDVTVSVLKQVPNIGPVIPQPPDTVEETRPPKGKIVNNSKPLDTASQPKSAAKEEQAKAVAADAQTLIAPPILQSTNKSHVKTTKPTITNGKPILNQDDSKAPLGSTIMSIDSIWRESSSDSPPMCEAPPPREATEVLDSVLPSSRDVVAHDRQPPILPESTTVQKKSSQVPLVADRGESYSKQDDSDTRDITSEGPCHSNSPAQSAEPLQPPGAKLHALAVSAPNHDEAPVAAAITKPDTRLESPNLVEDVPAPNCRSEEKAPCSSPDQISTSNIEIPPKNNPPFVAPRLINPATRGRKAAKPSDAAGQTPQCPIPVDSNVQAGSGLARLRGAHGTRPLVRTTSSVSNTTATRNQSFTRANGGPWSREAFDLFEYQRPG